MGECHEIIVISNLGNTFNKIKKIGGYKLIRKKDVRHMPFTFIIAPIVLVSLIFVVVITSNEMIEEKEFIVSLSCPELKEYTQNQIIDSKLYFGHEVYLSYAEERYDSSC